MTTDLKSSNVSDAWSQEFVQGGREHLFLTGGAQRVLEHALGKIEIRGGIKHIFKENLLSRRAFSEELGAQYCHIVAPDKHSVLVNEFPFEVIVRVGSVFKDLFGELFHYPVDELRSKNGGDAYWKTDTHWNLAGKLTFVKETLKHLGFAPDAIDGGLLCVEQNTRLEAKFCGDLGVKVSPRPSEEGLIYSRPSDIHYFSNNVTGSNGTTIIALNNNIVGGRFLIFCDSFAMSCIDLFSIFFREILVIRSAYFHKEIARDFAPTHIMSSNVERYLPSIPTDHEAPIALLIPQLLDKQMQPDPGFFKALNAQLRYKSLVYERFYESILSSN